MLTVAKSDCQTLSQIFVSIKEISQNFDNLFIPANVFLEVDMLTVAKSDFAKLFFRFLLL